MTSPERLRRGNAFQEIVQADFIANTLGGGAERELQIDLGPGRFGGGSKSRTGRVDIWIADYEEDAIAIFEIKATDWDLIAAQNIRRNIYRHQRQLLNYVYRYGFLGMGKVTYGLIYPRPPVRDGLRDEIETSAMVYETPVYWYTELNPAFDVHQIVI